MFCLLILCLYFPATSLSQNNQTTKKSSDVAPRDSVYKLSGGSSTLREVDGERVMEFNGGVRIIHGDVVITSDRGKHYEARGVTYLIGNVNIDQVDFHMESDDGEYHAGDDRAVLRRHVKIVDRGMTIICDEATYFRNADRAVLVGNVVVQDTSSTMTADRIVYSQLTEIAEAFGRVRITNSDEGIAVWGDHGYYFRGLGEGLIDENPRLIVDTDGDEPTTVDADTMHFFPDGNRAVAQGRVKIVKGDMITQCDSAVVIDSLKTAELYGNPLAKQGNVSMQSTRMVLNYNESEVNRIILIGDARITEAPSDALIVGRDNWMQGDSVVMHLRDNGLDSIRVMGNATSEYYPISPGKIESNFVRGDEMFFLFEQDSISVVEIRGHADGVYRFMDLTDSTTVDSLRAAADSSLSFRPFKDNAQKVIYSAANIRYKAKTRDLELAQKSKIVYDNRTLLGDSITYNADLQLMDASGEPVLIDGQEKFYGNQMDYALAEEIGVVTGGSTKFLLGYYNGEEIAKVGDNVLKVWNSHYTTCDRLHPHYRFQAKEMKVYMDDKVVSGPILLYIGDTPVFYLPFFAQNIRQGRRSGMLRPDFEFGIGSVRGRFIRDIGYYWATNQYTDLLLSVDFNENSSLAGRIQNRYRKRYAFEGGVNLRYIRDLIENTNQWTLDARHRQELGERFSLNADLRFVSDEQARRAVSNLDDVVDIIDRQVRSTATMSKTWDAAGFTVSGIREENLDVRDSTAPRVFTDFPNVQLSIPSRSLYFGSETRKDRRSFFGRMLGNVRYSPGINFDRQETQRLYDTEEIITSNQSLSFSAPTKLFFVSVSPTFSLRNQYRYSDHEEFARVEDDTTFFAASRDVSSDNEFNWNAGARANTNFYGTFYPEIGAFNALRHTMSPAVGYSYSPSRGNSPRRQSFGLSLNNTIDLKIGRGEEVRKLSGVLIWRLGSSFNPDADKGNQWSTISSTASVRVFGANVSYNQSLDPYTFEVINQGVSFGGLRLAGTHRLGISDPDDDDVEDATQVLNVIARRDTLADAGADERLRERDEFGYDTGGASLDDHRGGDAVDAVKETVLGDGDGLPWTLAIDFSYTQASFGDATSTLNLNGGANLTRSWRFSYSATYDLQNKILGRQAFSIYRQLHCWEMSLNRRQLGDEWEFYFKLTLTGHPELFLDQGNRGLGGPSGAGFGSFGF